MVSSIIAHNQDYQDFISKYIEVYLNNYDVVLFLNGPIGSGKTTLAKAVTKIYSTKILTISSFGILNFIKSAKNIIHCDFYRDSLTHEFFDLEILPLLNSPYILMIEWSEPKQYIKDAKHIGLVIRVLANGDREITLNLLN